MSTTLRRACRAAALTVLTGVWAPTVLTAQTPGSPAPCAAAPIAIPTPRELPALTEAQESDLGDAIAEHMEQFYRVVNDDAAGRLQAIGDRILQQLPPTKYRFRFLLVNLPDANAFATPGGRIYVARKLVVSTRTEDELAGVLAHEIGHVVTRQIAVDMSRWFRDALKVTSFGDRADVFEKYAALVESMRGTRGGRRLEDQQIEADQVGLLAVARAGYAPAAFIDWWDRIAATERRTGNFFTDLFGATRPEARRLREQLRTLATLPESCRAAAPRVADESYDAWRGRVIAATGRSPAESLRAVVSDTRLEPPISDGLTHLSFSPDGRHVLAQSESGIHVLSREPFAVRFRIDADGAGSAHFTPDSSRIVFATSDLRVETWDLASQSRAAVHELVTRTTCLVSALSPDGSLLGCLDDSLSIVLFDVPSGAVAFRKGAAYQINWSGMRRASSAEVTPFNVTFSPDGAYFIVGHASGETVVDVKTRAEVKLPGPTRTALRRTFTFVDAGRIAAVDPEHADASTILRFPSGELVKNVKLGGRLRGVTRGDAVIVYPLREWALGLVDLAADRVAMVSRRDALDAYDDLRIAEQPNGDIALFTTKAQGALATASLPRTRLGRVRAADVSSDLKWLALSGRDRGAMWDLTTGRRVTHLRGFLGVAVAEDGLVVDFPKFVQMVDGKSVEHPRTLVRFEAGRDEPREETAVTDDRVEQMGRFLLVRSSPKADEPWRDLTLDVRDVRTGSTLWNRRFDGDAPAQYADDTTGRLALEFTISSPAARRAIEQDPALRAQISGDKLKGGDAYIEVLDLQTGTLVGRLLVNTGRDGLRIQRVLTSGDAVTLVDRQNQVFVHSLTSGARRGRAFGSLAVPSAAAGLVCVQNEPTEIDCYDLQSMEHKAEIRLSASVRLLQFSDDGRRLLVVTSDQVAKVFDTAALRAAVP